jgi:Ca-activated chloride channel family protein
MGEIVKSKRPNVRVSKGTSAIKDRMRRQVQANLEAAKNTESLMLCLDVSGSMNQPFVRSDYLGPSRVAAMKTAANILVDGSNAHGCIMGVVAYSAKAVVVSYPTQDYEELKRQITSMRSGSSTQLGEGLFLCVEHLGKSNFDNKRIILLCDGQQSVHGPRADALEIVKRHVKPNKIRVDCIAIGEQVDVTLLRAIADMTGGVFLHPKTPEDLQTDFLKLESRARALLTSGD